MSDERWAAVEIMGHRRHVGRIAEESFAGATMLRVEALNRDGSFELIRYGGGSLFSVRDMTEKSARTAIMRKDGRPCAEHREPSAIEGHCVVCGYTREEHVAAKLLPAHDDDSDDSSPDSEDGLPW
jgi:hypothetical protein